MGAPVHTLEPIEDPTPAEVDAALIVLAACGGNSRKAEQLCGVPKTTLHRWRTNLHRDRYLELAERERPRLEQIAVEDAISTILQAGEIEHELFDLLRRSIEDTRRPPPQRDEYEDEEDFRLAYKAWTHRTSTKELGEAAAAIQRITTSKGINGTKLLELTGRPTLITEHRDGASILRELQQRVPGLIVDSTATEIPATQKALRDETGPANARGRA